MANWNNPTVLRAYDDYTGDVKDRDLDVAKGMDPAIVTVTNPVANMIRWNSANRYWEIYNGSTWGALASYYAIEVGAFTGDVAKSAGSSSLTIAANAVGDTALRDSAALSIIGRAENSSGDPGDISAASDDRILARVSSALSWSQLTVGMFPNDVVSYAKIQNVSATDRMLGRSSAGAGDIEEITVTPAGRALIDDADAAAQRATLGVPSGSGSSTGTNTGDNPGVTSVSGTAPIASSGGATPAISISAATVGAAGSMSAADKSKLDGIQSGATVGEVNTASNIGSGGVGVWSQKSGVDLQFKNIIGGTDVEDLPGGQTNITVAQAGQNITVTRHSAPAGGSSIHPDSRIEMADGVFKWLRDIRLGDLIRGREGPSEVLGIWRNTLGNRSLCCVNGVVCTPGHLFWTPNGWAAVSPESYTKTSHDKKRAVKGKHGLIETHCLLANPETLTKLDLGTEILAADGAWQKVTMLDHANVGGEGLQIAPNTEVIALFLDGGNLFYADGYAVATLA